jgi:uroporphyrinogen decarboxylase
MSISSRERLQLVLAGEMPDRVPVCPFVQDEYLSYIYPEKSQIDRVLDGLLLAKELGFDLIAKPRDFENPYFLKKSFPNWQLHQEQYTYEGKFYVRKTIATPEKMLTQIQVGPDAGVATSGLHLSTYEYFLKTYQDIEVFMKYLPQIDLETISEMKNTAEQWRNTLGDDGIAAPWGWCSVFNIASEYRNVEHLILDTFDSPDLYKAFMSKLARQMVIYNTVLAQTKVDCVGIQGNIANGSLFGSDYFAKLIEPYEKKVIDAIHAQNKFTIYHNCGSAKKLYPNYKRMGFTVWETVSEPPIGDNNLKEAKQYFGEKICLLGNMDQVNFLKTASSEEVAERTCSIIEAAKPGARFIFSTSDFLEKDTPLENVKTMIKVAKHVGYY